RPGALRELFLERREVRARSRGRLPERDGRSRAVGRESLARSRRPVVVDGRSIDEVDVPIGVHVTQILSRPRERSPVVHIKAAAADVDLRAEIKVDAAVTEEAAQTLDLGRAVLEAKGA